LLGCALVAIHIDENACASCGYTYLMSFAERALGWGIAIYAVMYLVWSAMVIYGLASGVISLGVRLLVLTIVLLIAARSLRLVARADILPYAAVWAATAITLDGVFLVPFAGWGLYSNWTVWLGYALVAVIPYVLFPLTRRHGRSH